MIDNGNDPFWHIDAGGNRYHRKATARRMPTQPTEERHPLYGPGIGHKRIDRLFDGIITAIIVGLCVATTVGMLGMVRADQPAQTPERGTIECSK